jgi:hypothetical protein
LSKVDTGGLPIPVGISKHRFDDPYWCGQPIRFYPSNDIAACGGWHTYDQEHDKIKQDILKGLIDAYPADFESPATEGGDEYWFKGGTDSAAYDLLDELFEQNKDLNDGTIDKDTNDETWTTTVVVYDSEDCSNPNPGGAGDEKTLTVVGFTTIVIYDICTASGDDSCEDGVKEIVADISCDYIEAQRGGGGEYGIIGSIAGLVAPPL